jgi:Right handed beta helix region
MHCTPTRWPTRLAPVIAATASLAITVGVVAESPTVEAGGRTIVVHPNESIQAAIDRAVPNTTIIVTGGVHAEQLTISTDGLTLVGRGTQLVPPTVADPNQCTGIAAPAPGHNEPTEAGICIIGHDVTFGPMTDHTPVVHVGRPVRSVRVTGFDIAGFSGPYVAVAGGQDVRVDGNHLTDTDRYGVLSTGSTNTHVTTNAITGPPGESYIGVCVQDIASPLVAGNDIAGQIIGICVSTTGANVVANRVHDGCMGMYVDPGVGATITLNHIFDNNACRFAGLEYGRGITMAGAQGTVVRLNVIEGHTAADGLPAIRLTDDVGNGNSGTGTVATGNVVTLNRIVHNTLDLVSTATGPNRITLNQCSTSVPVGLCD